MLSMQEMELVAKFSELAMEHPKLTFDEIAKEVVPQGFKGHRTAQLFKRTARGIFDLEGNKPTFR
jgi:hypothetical protein